MMNQGKTVLYIGVTSDISKRIYEHKKKVYPKSFTAKYNTDQLVYFERFDDITYAIAREKVLKKWKREWKENLIKVINPDFEDLSIRL